MVSLNRLSPSVKVLITVFVLSLAVGYGVACLQIFSRTGFSLEQAIHHYHGGLTEEEQVVYTPPTFGTLVSVSHVHTFSQPVMLGILGFLLTMTYLSEAAKILFILLSFLGSLVSNATPWLVRYLSPHWIFLMPLSQLVLMGTFFVMAGVILYDVWRNPEEED